MDVRVLTYVAGRHKSSPPSLVSELKNHPNRCPRLRHSDIQRTIHTHNILKKIIKRIERKEKEGKSQICAFIRKPGNENLLGPS